MTTKRFYRDKLGRPRNFDDPLRIVSKSELSSWTEVYGAGEAMLEPGARPGEPKRTSTTGTSSEVGAGGPVATGTPDSGARTPPAPAPSGDRSDWLPPPPKQAAPPAPAEPSADAANGDGAGGGAPPSPPAPSAPDDEYPMAEVVPFEAPGGGASSDGSNGATSGATPPGFDGDVFEALGLILAFGNGKVLSELCAALTGKPVKELSEKELAMLERAWSLYVKTAPKPKWVEENPGLAAICALNGVYLVAAIGGDVLSEMKAEREREAAARAAEEPSA